MRTVAMIVVLVVMVGSFSGSSSSDECVAKSSSSLYTCFPYVKAGNETAVGADCCGPLAAFVSEYPQCVCTLRTVSASIPDVNLTRAFLLNTLCSIPSNPAIPASCATASPAPGPADFSAGSSLSNEAKVMSQILPILFISLSLIWLLRQ